MVIDYEHLKNNLLRIILTMYTRIQCQINLYTNENSKAITLDWFLMIGQCLQCRQHNVCLQCELFFSLLKQFSFYGFHQNSSIQLQQWKSNFTWKREFTRFASITTTQLKHSHEAILFIQIFDYEISVCWRFLTM